MLPASLCAKIMVFRRITRIIEVVLNERAVEKIRLERPVLGQDTTDVLALACVDVEVHAATCLAERDADQSFGVGYRFHHSCFLLSANIHHSFIKMAYIPVFKA